MGFLNEPKTIDELEAEDERKSTEISVAQKRVLLAELKKKYGSDWKLHLPKVESGMDWNALKFQL